MSPHGRSRRYERRGFPRVSGDEPDRQGDARSYQRFSPRERG